MAHYGGALWHLMAHYGAIKRFAIKCHFEKLAVWFARVWALFSLIFQEQEYCLALASYLQEARGHRGQVFFRWSSAFPECVQVSNILRPVVMLRSYKHAKKSTDIEYFLFEKE
jgi:hypothetical protein